MARQRKAKTPQPPKGQKQNGQKMPQSAPPAKKPQGKFSGNEDTPRKGQGTPKAGDKRKLDAMLAVQSPGKGTPKVVNSKPSTPVASPRKGKPTPAKLPQTPQMVKPLTPRDRKTPQTKKTPQAKTPASSGKGGKKTAPQSMEEDDDEDEDDDEEDMGGLGMDSDDDEDDIGEDMDDDEDDDSDEDEEENEVSSPKKQVATIGKATEDGGEDDDDDEDNDDDDDSGSGSDMDHDSEDDEEEDDDEDAIIQKIRELREASNKPAKQQKQPMAMEQNSQAQKQSASPTKQKQEPKPPQSLTKQSPTKAKASTLPAEKVEKEQPQSPTKQKTKEESGKSPKAVSSASGSGQRDKCTLFVKNLPPTVSTSEIKVLSKDIKEVRFRITVRAKRREKKKMGYAFIEFASEAMADKNYKALQGAKIGDCELVVDYVGEKSKNSVTTKPQSKQEVADPDPLRLYVTGFTGEVKEADLYKLFPKAQQITIPCRKKDKTPIGYAFIAFATEQQCKTAHDKRQGAKLQGHSLVVLYAKKLSPEAQQKDKKLSQKNKDSQKTGQPPAKKAKVEGSDSDEEEDDDDDDDDEEEDDDSSEDDSDEGGDGLAGEDEDDDDEEEDDDDDDDEDDDDDDEDD